MTAEKSSLELVAAAVHRSHYGVFDAREGTYCDGCEQDWPCSTMDALRHVESTALRAVAVPVLLNDLADRIEASRPGVIGHQFNIGANAALSDAVALVRAAAEGWGTNA